MFVSVLRPSAYFAGFTSFESRIVKDVVRKQVEDRNQKERNAGLMEAWSHAQYAGETERERERHSITKNALTQCLYICVCSMHTFYTSPYKD